MVVFIVSHYALKVSLKSVYIVDNFIKIFIELFWETIVDAHSFYYLLGCFVPKISTIDVSS